MPPSGANATPAAAAQSTRGAYESHVRDSDVPDAILSVRSSELRDCARPGRGGACQPFSFSSERITRRGVRKVYLLLPWKSLFRGE